MAESVAGLLFLLFYCLTLVEGEIRCYCNESGCVSTGYMCKSNLGTCYSLVTYQGDTLDAVHGCADSLSDTRKAICFAKVPKDTKDETNEATRTVRDNEPIVLCCTDDMCNYRDHLDISVVIDTQANESANDGENSVPGSTMENKSLSKSNINEKNPEKDLWFKAAVIAVPIAGGFILILLVLLAVRMLRTDSRHHRRLIQIRRERSLTKAQLYVTDHFIDHSDKGHSVYGNKLHPGHRDPKIMVDKDGNKYEQVCTDRNNDKQVKKSSHQPSIIIWGRPKKSDPATVV